MDELRWLADTASKPASDNHATQQPFALLDCICCITKDLEFGVANPASTRCVGSPLQPKKALTAPSTDILVVGSEHFPPQAHVGT